MDAFKCDGCKQLFEGEASRSHDLDLGEFALRFSVARKQEPKEREEKLELGAPEMLHEHLMALPMFKRKPDVADDGRELWAADLCAECTLDLFKQALIRAQTDSIAEALTDSVGEFHE